MAAISPFKFRVRISPDWQALHPVIKERAARLGFKWPASSHPARFPRVYTVTLNGTSGSDGLQALEVLALEPPKETTVSSDLKAWEKLDVSFKVAGKKAFVEANPGNSVPPDALAVRLDAAGLFLPAVSETAQPVAMHRLVDIPMAQLVQRFADLAAGRTKITRTGVDHIVERYSSPADLETFQVSRWRGDGFYRLTAPWVRVEVNVDNGSKGVK